MDGGAGEETTNLVTQVQDCFSRAVPLLGSRPAVASAGSARAAVLLRRTTKTAEPTEEQDGFLLVPASDAGKEFGEQAQATFPALQLVRVAGQHALLFCREQGCLSLDELQRLLHSCRSAYQEAAVVPTTSPHSRSDINDWMPLDP
jgi:hypothetical protein